MSAAWSFLVHNGAVSTIVKFATTLLLGWLVKLVKTHVKQQKKIEDLLDTKKPGGLTDVVEAIKDQPQK